MTRSIPTAFVIGLAISWSLLHVVLAFSGLSMTTHPYASLAALALCLLMMAYALFPRGGQLSPAMSPLLVAGTAAVTGLVLWGLPLDAWPGYSAWFQGSLECLLITIAMRRRPRTALLACAVMTVMVLAWSTQTVSGLGEGIRLVVAPVTLTVIAVGLARFLASNDARAETYLRQAIELTEQAAAADARRAEARAWARDVGAAAGPALRAAADPDIELSEEDQAELVRVATTLRDQVRGGELTTSAVLALVADARARGVAVNLLDDRGAALTPMAQDHLTAALRELVPHCVGGTLTIRSRPVSSSPPVATIAYVPADADAESTYLEI